MKCFVLLSLIFAASAYLPTESPTLYGTVTEILQGEEIGIFVVKADYSTGKVTNVTEMYQYPQEYTTVDGISGLNLKAEIYYFANDIENDLIYSADLNSGKVRTPLNVSAEYIVNFRYNIGKNLMYALIHKPSGLHLVKIDSGNTVKDVIPINGTAIHAIQVQMMMGIAVDPDNDIFFMIAGTNKNATNPQYKLFQINANTGDTISVSNVLNFGVNPAFVQYVAYDENTKMMYGLLESYANNALGYRFFTLNPSTGAIHGYPLTSIDGIATCATYSPSLHSLFIHIAPNGPGLLYQVNVKTGALSNPVQLINGYWLDNMEVTA